MRVMGKAPLSSPDRGPRRKKPVETLPKILPGAVCEQWVRCGREGCRCTGDQPHGPYYYRFWREGVRLRKQYVPPQEVEEVRARCQARRQERQELDEWREEWRRMAALVREVEER